MDLWDRIVRAGFLFYRKLETDVHPLRYLFWEATLKCNLGCRHCGSDCTKDAKFPELSSDEILAVFENIASRYDSRHIMVVVTGGEPIVRKDLFPILDKARKLGFRLGMVTNGFGWKKALVAKAGEVGLESLTVSVDGMKESHNWLRNHPRSYDAAVETLRMFVQSRNVPVVEALTDVFPRNLEELDDVYALLRNLGVRHWRIINIFSAGRAEGDRELLLDRAEYRRLISEVVTLRARGKNDGMKVNFTDEGYLGPPFERRVRDGCYFCRAGINIAGIMADGAVSACPNLSRDFVQGNIKERPFTEMWEKGFEIFRDRRWMMNGPCAVCPEWNACLGNSLHTFDMKRKEPRICHFKIVRESKSFQ